VTVRARSRVNPDESAAVEAHWTVLPFFENHLELRPRRAVGWRRAVYTVTVENAGNAPERYTLSADDDEQMLVFLFHEPQVVIKPGSTAKIRCTVLSETRLFGKQQVMPFVVLAKPVGRGGPVAANAEFVRHALLPAWALSFALVLFVVLALLLAAPFETSTPEAALDQIGARIARWWPGIIFVLALAVVLPNWGRLTNALRQHDTIDARSKSRQRPAASTSSAFQSKRPNVTLTGVESSGHYPGDSPLAAGSAPTGKRQQTAVFKHSSLVSRVDDQIIEELVLHKDYEHLWRAIAYAEGGRYLLTGYGPFGGTSLVNCAVEKARSELQRNGSGEGALLVFHFRLTKEHANEFEVEANSFSFGHLKAPVDRKGSTDIEALKAYAREGTSAGSSVQRMDFSLASPLNASFLRKTWGTTLLPGKSVTYDLPKFAADLHDFLEQHQDNTALRQIILRLMGSEVLPSRIVIIFDKIRYLETLETLAGSDLFGNKRILALVVARKEDYDQWKNADQMLNSIGFMKWYVPCLWGRQLDKVLFEAVVGPGQEVEEHWQKFCKHLEFTGRGSLGNVMNELRQSKNTSHDASGSFIDIAMLGNRDEVRHNAWLQDVLELNWPSILSNLFVGKYQSEIEDRARIGVYYLLDWIARENLFTPEQIRDAARQTPVTIADVTVVVERVIENLLQVLVRSRYLEQHDGQYRVIWDKSNPPLLQRIRLKGKKQRVSSDSRAGGESVKPDTYNTVVVPPAGLPPPPDEGPAIGAPVDATAPQPDVPASSAQDRGQSQLPPSTSAYRQPPIPQPTSTGSTDEDRGHLEELRAIKKRRLQVFERQAAAAGEANVDPKVAMEIEELREEIQRLDNQLAGM
jgi:hypothetical protein